MQSFKLNDAFVLHYFLGESILVLGGREEEDIGVNPVEIQFNDDGSTVLERCLAEKYERRFNPVGDFLDGKFVICGGSNYSKIKQDCEVIHETGIQTFKLIANGRDEASFVKLNQSLMWITGGSVSPTTSLNSTELVTVNGSTAGVSLPFTITRHCMVEYQPNIIFLIGGELNGQYDSKKTWIIDPTNGFNITEGPTLNQGRMSHSCEKIKDEYGNVLVIVAGGYKLNSIEVLNITHSSSWFKG